MINVNFKLNQFFVKNQMP